jgi:hypothetical protein
MTIRTLLNQHKEILNKTQSTKLLLNNLDIANLCLNEIDTVLQEQITLITNAVSGFCSNQVIKLLNIYFLENNEKINDAKKYYISLDKKLFDGNFKVSYEWGNFTIPEINTKLYNLQNTNITTQSEAKESLEFIQKAANINAAEKAKLIAHKALLNDYLNNLICYEHVLVYFEEKILKDDEAEKNFDFNLQICDANNVHNILFRAFDLTNKANSPIYNKEQRSLINFSYEKLEYALQAIYKAHPIIDPHVIIYDTNHRLDNISDCLDSKYLSAQHDLLTLQNAQSAHAYILDELSSVDIIIAGLLNDPRVESELWNN